MICPKCGSENVTVSAVTETKHKTRWILGCLFTWLAFLIPKSKSKTHTEAVCQNCGNRWEVTSKNVEAASGAPVDVEPFYKKIWFLIVCGLLLPPVGIALVWLVHKDLPQKKKYIYTAIMAGWFILAMIFGGSDDNGQKTTPDPSAAVVSSVESETAESVDSAETPETTTTTTTTTPATTTTTTPSMTMGEKNALKKAKSYLDLMAFSYKGLIEQLEFDGFSHEEAVFAADNCGADWNEQAVKKAKSYLDLMAFSRKELIEQLEYEGFTHEQAVYGAEQNGY